jgi:acyl carrier protein
MSSLQTKIDGVLAELLASRTKGPPTVSPEMRLIDDLHLDSLHIARLVAMLEFETGLDPFSSSVAITSIERVEDLYRAYASCMDAAEGTPT